MAGIFGSHTGAWGTPDFGVTEWIGSKFGNNRTAQGGSNLIGRAGQAAYTPPAQNNIQPPTGFTEGPDITKSNGSVLGATTSSGGSGTYNQSQSNTNSGPQPSFNQEQPQNNYNPLAEIDSMFDGLMGSFGPQQTDLEGRIKSSADLQKTGINEQLGYGVQNLNTSRENVRSSQANTLADLAQNMRDQARNVGNYLGARGSGNSSANDAASFALQKVFGKERAGVQRQGMQQLGDIDMTENNLKAKAAEMLNGVDTWANSEMSNIATQFNELKNNIGMMRGNMRVEAVQALWNRANEIQSMRDQYVLGIQNSAQTRLQQLNDYKLQLSQSSNFNPSDIVYSEYGFNPTESYQPENYDMFNPLATARKRKETI